MKTARCLLMLVLALGACHSMADDRNFNCDTPLPTSLSRKMYAHEAVKGRPFCGRMVFRDKTDGLLKEGPRTCPYSQTSCSNPGDVLRKMQVRAQNEKGSIYFNCFLMECLPSWYNPPTTRRLRNDLGQTQYEYGKHGYHTYEERTNPVARAFLGARKNWEWHRYKDADESDGLGFDSYDVAEDLEDDINFKCDTPLPTSVSGKMFAYEAVKARPFCGRLIYIDKTDGLLKEGPRTCPYSQTSCSKPGEVLRKLQVRAENVKGSIYFNCFTKVCLPRDIP